MFDVWFLKELFCSFCESFVVVEEDVGDVGDVDDSDNVDDVDDVDDVDEEVEFVVAGSFVFFFFVEEVDVEEGCVEVGVEVGNEEVVSGVGNVEFSHNWPIYKSFKSFWNLLEDIWKSYFGVKTYVSNDKPTVFNKSLLPPGCL